MKKVQEGELKEFQIEDDILRFRRRVCVPDVAEIKKEIMQEAHCTPYTAHLGSTKMYQDLHHNFWWMNENGYFQFCLQVFSLSASKSRT